MHLLHFRGFKRQILSPPFRYIIIKVYNLHFKIQKNWDTQTD